MRLLTNATLSSSGSLQSLPLCVTQVNIICILDKTKQNETKQAHSADATSFLEKVPLALFLNEAPFWLLRTSTGALTKCIVHEGAARLADMTASGATEDHDALEWYLKLCLILHNI